MLEERYLLQITVRDLCSRSVWVISRHSCFSRAAGSLVWLLVTWRDQDHYIVHTQECSFFCYF